MLNTALIEEKILRTEEADNPLLKRKSLYLPESIGLNRFISILKKPYFFEVSNSDFFVALSM